MWVKKQMEMQIEDGRAARIRFFFFDSRGGTTGLGTSREALGRRNLGHRHDFRCRLGMPGLREKRSFVQDRIGVATGLGTSRVALSKGIPWS